MLTMLALQYSRRGAFKIHFGRRGVNTGRKALAVTAKVALFETEVRHSNNGVFSCAAQQLSPMSFTRLPAGWHQQRHSALRAAAQRHRSLPRWRVRRSRSAAGLPVPDQTDSRGWLHNYRHALQSHVQTP